jgi:DNA-binding transcriptional regulator YdaS (Cro superfamily)
MRRKPDPFRNRNKEMKRTAIAALQEAIEVAGSQVKLAGKLKIKRASVQQWTRADGCPLDRIVELEKVTGVPREKLAPELFVGVKLQRAA